MNVGYYPYNDDTNRYIDISKKCIRNLGHKIIDFKKINGSNVDKIDCVILNWYESVAARNFIKAFYKTRKRKRVIKQCKRNGVKIITTFHNKQPHDINNAVAKMIINHFYKWLIRMSDRIIVLSNDSKKYLRGFISKQDINNKCFLIPHPSYIDDSFNESLMKKTKNMFEMLFIGQIRPYKNIEILIDAVKDLDDIPISLRIVGKPLNEKYSKALIKRSEPNKNISFSFGFVPEEDLVKNLYRSTVVVLPYDLRSSMNSGTVLLSFSNMRTVICPRISTLSDFDKNLFYSYTYSNEQEHRKALADSIRKAYEDWDYSSKTFAEKGIALYMTVKERNSIQALTERYSELLRDI